MGAVEVAAMKSREHALVVRGLYGAGWWRWWGGGGAAEVAIVPRARPGGVLGMGVEASNVLELVVVPARLPVRLPTMCHVAGTAAFGAKPPFHLSLPDRTGWSLPFYHAAFPYQLLS